MCGQCGMKKEKKRVLLLGSQSVSRQTLLKDASIPFMVIDQSADEMACDWGMPIEQLVKTIAAAKMAHVVIQPGVEGEVVFVLTADSLSLDKNGVVGGKPVDREDAKRKLRAARGGTREVTAFCLERKKCISGVWRTDAHVIKVVSAECVFDVPEQWLEHYLDNSIGLKTANAISVEGYGAQFFRLVQGSYSSIMGLPMVEVREALEELGFFDE